MIGMTFGWIVGTVLFYVLGMCIIKKCFKKFYTESSKSSDVPRYRKPSSSSDEPALRDNRNPMKSRAENTDVVN